MPNDYSLVREKRKSPKIEMGKGMHQVEPGDPGTGKFSDRIKIKPKWMPEDPGTPQASDTTIHNLPRTAETQI